MVGSSKNDKYSDVDFIYSFIKILNKFCIMISGYLKPRRDAAMRNKNVMI